MSRDWNLENFAKFWANIEHEYGMQLKFEAHYLGDFGPPCDCGSSTCDECNPGWEDEDLFEDDPEAWEDYI